MLPVVMATYNRAERFTKTLDMLNAQTYRDFTLNIWNNNPDIKKEIDSNLKLSSVETSVYHSKENVGPWGRFELAKKLAKDYPFVLFIDDDQVFGRNFISMLVEEARKKTIVGGYAWRFRSNKNYWLRDRCGPGEKANYIGSAGTIHDTSLFKNKKLFDYPEFAFGCDDLWASYFANHVLKWDLICSATKTNLVVDGKDISLTLKDDKIKLLDYLRKEKGWEV